MKGLLLALCVWLPALAAEPVLLDWRGTEPAAPAAMVTPAGTPVFLRELYSLRREEDFRLARHLGFNAVIEQGELVFPHAAEYGFLVTEASWWHAGFAEADVETEIDRWRDRPELLAYNLNDEPDLRQHTAGPEVLRRAGEIIRRRAPGARLSATFAGWGRTRESWPAYFANLDIVRVDPYPLIANRPLSEVRALVAEARRVAGPSTPIVCILQAWTWPGGPFPNAAQVRQMAWQAIIAGANGLSWFDWNDATWRHYPDFWDELNALNHELVAHLEPALCRGLAYPPWEAQDVIAGLWTSPEGGWRLLATRLGETDGGRDLRLLLPEGLDVRQAVVGYRPGHGFGPVSVDDGAIALTLAPGESVLVLSAPPPAPVAGERWRTDWAGRPLAPLADPLAPPGEGAFTQTASPDRLSPWQRAGLSLTVSGDGRGQNRAERAGDLFVVAPGTRQRLSLVMSSRTVTRVHLEAVSWHDNETLLTGEAVAERCTLRAVSDGAGEVRPGLSAVYELTVHLPVETTVTERCHLLTLRVTFTLDGETQVAERVIRFRLVAPAVLAWEWTGDATGRIAVVPAMSASTYMIHPDRWRLRLAGDGLRLSAKGYGLTRDVRLDAIADGLLGLKAKVTADGARVSEGVVMQVVGEGGRLRRADQPKVATAGRLTDVKPDVALVEVWPQREKLAPLQWFMPRGAAAFAGTDHRAWFGWDEDCLYWFMSTPISQRELRAETTRRDSAYLGDTLATLFLKLPDGPFYYLQTNPAGITWDARIEPSFDLGWSPELRISSDWQDGAWRLVVAIPWRDLGLSAAPSPGTELRLNLGAAHSIAPRVWHSWHLLGMPFDPAAHLGSVILLP